MGFPQHQIDWAFSQWINNQSLEKITEALKTQFPDEITPKNWKTVLRWKDKYDWQGKAKIISRKADEIVIKKESAKLAKRREKQERMLERFDDHVTLHLNRVRRRGGEVIASELEAGEMAALMTVFNKGVVTGRLIAGESTEITEHIWPDLDFPKMTLDELKAVRDGALKGIPPQRILAPERLAEVEKKGG